MWRFLLQAGLGAASFNVGARVRRVKRMAIFFAIAGVLALLGLAALLVAAGVLLEPHVGAAGAAGIIGGALFVIAALLGWAATWQPRRPTATPVAERVRSELKAAGNAFSSGAPRLGSGLGASSSRTRGLNVVLMAALAGIVLGRRL